MVDFGTPAWVDGSRLPAGNARRFQHNQTGGARGVVRPGDLKVTALDVPGPGVKIAAGDDLIPCRDPERSRETYNVPLVSSANYMGDGKEANAGLPGTGSSGGRRDMIIHEITDPALSRTYTPRSEIPAGVLSKISVVPGVPASAKTVEDVPELANVTCYELAAINYPASTATITNAMIENLRQVARPQKDRVLRAYNLAAGQSSILSNGAAYPTGGQTFPQQFVDAIARIFIPVYATHARVVQTWSSVKYPAGSNAEGFHWVQIGENSDPNVRRTQVTGYAAPMTNDLSDSTWTTADTIAIPPAMRGKAVYFFPRANQLSSGQAGKLPWMGSSSAVILDVEFFEEAV